MMCDSCRDANSCPACNGELIARADGLYCSDCGYYKRMEQTLAMTEVRKPCEEIKK
jgi:primosomal protein N'